MTIRAWLSWVNRVDAGTLTASAEQLPDAGIANLKTWALGECWRPGVGSAYFDVDFGAAYPLQQLGLFGATFGATDTVRHRLSNVAPGGSELLDTGAIASGCLPAYRQHVHCLTAGAITARYWRCSIAAAAAFQIGRAWAGPVWTPSRGNYAYNNQRRRVSLSKVVRGDLSGLRDSQRGAQLRGWQFALPALTEADAWALDEMLALVDRTGQVLFTPRPGGQWQQREALLGGLDQLDPIVQPNLPLNSLAFSITEDP